MQTITTPQSQTYTDAVSYALEHQSNMAFVAEKFGVSYAVLRQKVAAAKKQQSTAPANDTEIASLQAQIKTLQERLDERADTQRLDERAETPTTEPDADLAKKYETALQDLKDEKAETKALNKALDVYRNTDQGKRLADAEKKLEKKEEDYLAEIVEAEEKIEELTLQVQKLKAKPAAYQGPRTTLNDVVIVQQAMYKADIALQAKETEENYQKKLSASRIYEAVNKACPQ